MKVLDGTVTSNSPTDDRPAIRDSVSNFPPLNQLFTRLPKGMVP
nr:MAG TPA: hypothetical protein [Caudoviricetes sp.]